MRLGEKKPNGCVEEVKVSLTREQRDELDTLRQRTRVPTAVRIRRGIELAIAEALEREPKARR